MKDIGNDSRKSTRNGKITITKQNNANRLHISWDNVVNPFNILICTQIYMLFL